MTTTAHLPGVRTEIERGLRRSWHTGAQVYASLRGRTVADFALGEARPGVPMATDTIVEWASATKPVTCSAAALLWQQGLFDLDDPVCRHLPHFAENGKETVTVRHLLTHSAGLSDPGRQGRSWEAYAEAVCRAPLLNGWVLGKRFTYNSVGMWAVASLVVSLSGLPFWRFVREELFAPLGITDSWIGMPPETYRAYGPSRLAAIPGAPNSGTEAHATWGRPTGGGHGPIRDLGRFYAAVLTRKPPFPLSPPVIDAMTIRQLCGVHDELLDATVDRGLGYQLGSSYTGHSYGPYASRRTFGHGGGSWSLAFADPEHGLASAVYFNGAVDAATQAERVPALLAALYLDLSLA
jgi:CubicO group peptidase (beta-lactamase class C family)